MASAMVEISLLRGGRALEASTLQPAAKSASAMRTTSVQRIVCDMLWVAGRGEKREGCERERDGDKLKVNALRDRYICALD